MFPEQYRLKPEAYTRARKKILIAVGPLFLAVAIPIFYSKFYNADGKPTDWKQVIIIGSVMTLFVAISIFRLIQKKKKNYEEFILIIDQNRITGKDLNGNEIDLSWIEVTRIVKEPGGGFLLVSGANNNTIEIPGHIENAERLETALNQVSPVLLNPVTFFSRNSKAIILVVFGVLILFIYSMNKWVIGITGPILDILFIWLFISLSRVKQTDMQTIKIKWFLLLPIVGIILKVFIVLTGRHLF